MDIELRRRRKKEQMARYRARKKGVVVPSGIQVEEILSGESKEEKLSRLRDMMAVAKEPNWTAGPGSNGEIETPPVRFCGNGKWRCGTKVTRELRGVPFCEAHYRLQEGADFD